MTTLTVNNRVYRLEVIDGEPCINGMGTQRFIESVRAEPQGDIAMRHILAFAVQLLTAREEK